MKDYGVTLIKALNKVERKRTIHKANPILVGWGCYYGDVDDTFI